MIYVVQRGTLRKWKQTVFYLLSHFADCKRDIEGLNLTDSPPAVDTNLQSQNQEYKIKTIK